jgi:lysophospholipase L1-like esterase
MIVGLALISLVQTPAAFDDHAHMMQLLGVRALRRGPDPNNQSTFDEALANVYMSSLPAVLRFKNGGEVKTKAQWRERRKEIVEDFEQEVYGRIPRNVPKVTWEITSVVPGESGGIPTVTRTLTGHVDNRSDPQIEVNFQASYTIPAHPTRPVPVMVEFGGFRPRPYEGKTWQELAISKGWGYGSINPNSIQPDNAKLNTGIIGLCNKGGYRKPDDWGALRAWAWGFSRLIDYFEQHRDSGIDPRKVGIEGVSRYGKAALVAEAFDQRVAVGFIASSGEGGSKLHRRIFGEQIENLAGGEFYWMAGNIIKYGASDPWHSVAELPVDSHELIALCAPRPCFISHGVVEKGDAKWIDAHGSFTAEVYAAQVYRLLGKRAFVLNDMPPVGLLVGGELAWRQHEGGHEATPNWPSFFDWVAQFIQAPLLSPDKSAYVVKPSEPAPRSDANSQAAHAQLLEKRKKGKIDVYFVGDSIVRRWGTSDPQYKDFLANWTQNFFGWNAADFGWGADTTQNILWRLRNGELDGVNPKVIVILAGTNNVPNASEAEIAQGIEAIVNTCQSKAPSANILVTGIFPRNDHPGLWPKILEMNHALARLAGHRIRYLDVNSKLADSQGTLLDGMMVDGLHPSVRGYQVWADGLKPILKGILGPPSSKDLAPAPTGDPGIKG